MKSRLLHRLERACWWLGSRFYRVAGRLAAIRNKGQDKGKVIPYTYTDLKLVAWLDGGKTVEEWRRSAN